MTTRYIGICWPTELEVARMSMDDRARLLVELHRAKSECASFYLPEARDFIPLTGETLNDVRYTEMITDRLIELIGLLGYTTEFEDFD
jgi:hypothetical protein